jgi:hypothetical protein
MDIVIGLLSAKQKPIDEINHLEETGITRDNIRVLNQIGAIYKLFGCNPKREVIKYAGWGALFGILIYGIFSAAAGWCECNIFKFSTIIGLEVVFIGLLFGGLGGGFMGSIVGMAMFEKDTHLYIQGVRMGDKVITVQSDKEDTLKVDQMLRQIGCTGVKAISRPNEELHVS